VGDSESSQNKSKGGFMLGVGKKLPEFNLKGVVSADQKSAFIDIHHKTYEGKWLVLFFYPKDFTFVCPTEIKGFGDLNKDFQDRDAQVLTASIDSEFVHLAWKQNHKDLTDLPFPMLSDIKRELSTALGVLDEEDGVAQRATFIIDPGGVIQYASVNAMNVGRNPKEVLRVLDALQTDELCPCNWKKGEDTIKV
jgi:lipoyl-dependent peroxiredoxin subunit C